MNLNEIEKIMQNSAGLKTCPVCGLPYKPYHARQKTCGAQECKRISHAESARKRAENAKANNPEEYRERRRASSKKSRRKRKIASDREAQLKELSERWGKQMDFEKKISEYGANYGEVSARKVLEKVPKINVSMEGERNDNKNG